MRSDKDKATELRRSGKSYKQIREELKIPLSTLSEWFSGEEWSAAIRSKLTESAQEVSTARIKELDKVRGYYLEKAYREAREEAIVEFETLKYNPLFIAGMMLYWGEGTKSARSQIRLANSDPEMIKLFLAFLEKACRIPRGKLRLAILSYPDLDEASLRRFWSFATGIPLSQFHKTMVIKGRHTTRKLTTGVCTVVVSSTYFREKFFLWLNLLPKELMKREYYEIIPPKRP